MLPVCLFYWHFYWEITYVAVSNLSYLYFRTRIKYLISIFFINFNTNTGRRERRHTRSRGKLVKIKINTSKTHHRIQKNISSAVIALLFLFWTFGTYQQCSLLDPQVSIFRDLHIIIHNHRSTVLEPVHLSKRRSRGRLTSKCYWRILLHKLRLRRHWEMLLYV